jgi:quercetin dioxygenase-like cupin family protein
MRFVGEQDVESAAAPADRFSEGVWQSEMLPAIREGGLRGLRFVYGPGGRSNWHVHRGEQALVVVAGRGVVVRWGEAKGTAVGPGDWVHVEPGEKHWHGAASDDVFVHLAITATGGTDWYEPVDDDEYQRAVE